MITFKNAGPAGGEYSKLEVRCLEKTLDIFIAVKGKQSCDIQLNREQAGYLAQEILRFYPEEPVEKLYSGSLTRTLEEIR